MTTVVAAALLLPLGQSTLAQNFKTVQDHFLGIPELPVGSLAQRQRYLRYGLVDIPKGYMRYRASDHPEQFEFAIFRKKNGRYLAALSVPYDPDFLPEQPGKSRLILLDYHQGQWRDVTQQRLPVPFDPTLTYRLPRVGRDVVVVNRRGQKLYRLRWQDDRFVRLGM